MNVSEMLKEASRLDVHQVNFFPIIRAYMQRLGLVELINHRVGGQMEVQPGLIVAGMIQDTLSGRTPLYHLERFFEDQDIEMLVGESVPICAFADHNVGRVLDRIAEIGASNIFGEIARRAATVFDIDTSCGHWDSTSVSLSGEYDGIFPDNSLKITFGYSKDHRPDLKQFMISMLCVERNIPILGETHDGNSSDKTLNNKLLTRISKNLAQNGLGEGAFTYVADSAMVTEENLAFFDPIPNKAPLYFVTRLPHTYGQANQAIHEAIGKDNWQPIGVLSRSSYSPNRPIASYKASETTVELYGRSYRALVIHSSAHDKRRQKRIDREIADSRKNLMKLLAKRKKDAFFCQADAEAECSALRSLTTPFHALEPRIEQKPIYAQGRPKKDGSRTITGHTWHVTADVIEQTEAIEQKRAEAGCFVLITNRPLKGEDAQTTEDILRTYKAQDGIERNFSFLKDPLIVNNIFLKKPQRIEALGMVLLLSLLIWNLIQRQMRMFLEKTDSTIEGLNRRKTTRPTTYAMLTHFRSVQIIRHGNVRILKKPLKPVQKDYLQALGLSEAIFTSTKPPPPPEKSIG